MTRRRRRQLAADCARKVRYPTWDAAFAALRAVTRKGAGDWQMRPYKCQVKQGHWHLGHFASLRLEQAFATVAQQQRGTPLMSEPPARGAG